MRRRRAAVATIVVAAGLISCTSEPEPATPEDYLAGLAAICTETTDRLAALPTAPDQISVVDLATSAASLLDNEALRADRLDVPADDQLEDDHRAFVRNTIEQADAWRAIAAADDPATDLVPTTDLIRQLVGGRNDLSAAMDVPECRRDGL